jgi:CheY-like chemotaxis protein
VALDMAEADDSRDPRSRERVAIPRRSGPSEETVAVPLPKFIDLVRDALLHVYDVGYLQAHPLLGVMEPRATGPRLRQALLDAIEALRPGADVAPTARAWRLHHILEARYIECHEVAEVMEQVALSSAQYHREHHRALQMVAVLLWERWQVAGRWPAAAGEAPSDPAAGAESIRREAEGLVHDRHAGRVDLGQVVEHLRPLVGSLAAGRPIDLLIDAPEALPAIAGERVAVRQLLLVLLSQVVGAVERGVIEMGLSQRGRQVVVAVSGPATAAPGQVQRGLAESRPFVEALRGTICHQAATAPDGRWTIEIGLPVYTRPTLLVVDNNADFLRLVELYLTGGDWEIVGASSVEEATAHARRLHPNVILLDVIIPGRDGWDLLLDLRAHAATLDIPVIICSVLNEPSMATALGATAYLQKPVSQGQLMAALEPFQ